MTEIISDGEVCSPSTLFKSEDYQQMVLQFTQSATLWHRTTEKVNSPCSMREVV